MIRIIFLGMFLFTARPASAGLSLSDVKLLSFSGRITIAGGASASGTSVKVLVDLNRDGSFTEAESNVGGVDPNGDYEIGYIPALIGAPSEFISLARNLISDFEEEGFGVLVKISPLAAAITFEKEGYSTVTKTFGVMNFETRLDVTLTPLQPLGCSGTVCATPNGEVSIGGLPTVVRKAYARAYDLQGEADRFPGSFSDSKGNLLISSGFAEVDLRDKQGNRVGELPSPVTFQFMIARDSWPTLSDQVPGNGRIDLPIYSFDDSSAEWKSESNGVLVDAAGKPIPETELGSLRAGESDEDVFAQIVTKHFSQWNVDQPVESHACVKGRMVDDSGGPLEGASVTVRGVSYEGWEMDITTGPDGYFAMGVMKSESAGEDVNKNGASGETFRAKVVLKKDGRSAEGMEFDTSTSNKQIVENKTLNCLPALCECPDLGDVKIMPKEPRLCEITGTVSFSGRVTLQSQETKAPVTEGTPLSGLQVSAISDATGIEWESICGPSQCQAVSTDASGSFRIVFPIVDVASLTASVSLDRSGSELKDNYYGRFFMSTCPDLSITGVPDLKVDYAALIPADIALAEAAGPDENGTASCGCGGTSSSNGFTAADASNTLLFSIPLVALAFIRKLARP